jgi:hypothetical protein
MLFGPGGVPHIAPSGKLAGNIDEVRRYYSTFGISTPSNLASMDLNQSINSRTQCPNSYSVLTLSCFSLQAIPMTVRKIALSEGILQVLSAFTPKVAGRYHTFFVSDTLYKYLHHPYLPA